MSESPKRIVLTRREALLLSATAGIGMAGGGSAFASESIKTAEHQETDNCSTPGSAVAKTQYGKVRGFLDGGVFTFKGVPYGQTTAGENRWLPAKPPAPWTDEYPALVYGPNCPQNLHTWTSPEQTFLFDWDDGWQSEDMLKLNIWTPSLTGRRPVMFYIHGGGYSFGSSYELPSHDGAQMARHHNVVQVSVNHRLNILGFFDVSEIGGSAYEGSANVGMTAKWELSAEVILSGVKSSSHSLSCVQDSNPRKMSCSPSPASVWRTIRYRNPSSLETNYPRDLPGRSCGAPSTRRKTRSRQESELIPTQATMRGEVCHVNYRVCCA
jgi:hypothetical protein